MGDFIHSLSKITKKKRIGEGDLKRNQHITHNTRTKLLKAIREIVRWLNAEKFSLENGGSGQIATSSNQQRSKVTFFKLHNFTAVNLTLDANKGIITFKFNVHFHDTNCKPWLTSKLLDWLRIGIGSIQRLTASDFPNNEDTVAYTVFLCASASIKNRTRDIYDIIDQAHLRIKTDFRGLLNEKTIPPTPSIISILSPIAPKDMINSYTCLSNGAIKVVAKSSNICLQIEKLNKILEEMDLQCRFQQTVVSLNAKGKNSQRYLIFPNNISPEILWLIISYYDKQLSFRGFQITFHPPEQISMSNEDEDEYELAFTLYKPPARNDDMHTQLSVENGALFLREIVLHALMNQLFIMRQWYDKNITIKSVLDENEREASRLTFKIPLEQPERQFAKKFKKSEIVAVIENKVRPLLESLDAILTTQPHPDIVPMDAVRTTSPQRFKLEMEQTIITDQGNLQLTFTLKQKNNHHDLHKKADKIKKIIKKIAINDFNFDIDVTDFDDTVRIFPLAEDHNQFFLLLLLPLNKFSPDFNQGAFEDAVQIAIERKSDRLNYSVIYKVSSAADHSNTSRRKRTHSERSHSSSASPLPYVATASGASSSDGPPPRKRQRTKGPGSVSNEVVNISIHIPVDTEGNYTLPSAAQYRH